jgi:hypothetical protein
VAANEPKKSETVKNSPPSPNKTDSSDKIDDKSKTSANPAVDDKSLQEIMAEVKELGVLDPQQQNKLLEDLRQTDPALWPLMVKQVHAAVAYRRKTMERDQTAQHGDTVAAAPKGDVPKDPPVNRSEEEELASVTLPLGSEPANIAEKASDNPPGKLPPSVITAKAMPKNSPNATLPPKNDAVVVSENPAAEQKKNGSKPSSAKTRDIQTLDVKSLDAEEQVLPVSYESPADTAAETSKTMSPAAVQDSKPNADWRAHIDQAIRAMESETPDKPKTEEELAKQARLRMLYALAGRREDAVKPIPAAPPAMQDFWSKELYGLTVLLDTQRTPDSMTRAAEAKQHLGEGYSRLGEMAPLGVRNLSFCTVVQSYGCYTPFKKYEFMPSQEVLLYAEVENFGIESTPKGYHTTLRSSYQILDAGGQRIADHAISTTEEYCQNPRRDFFIGYQLRMPSRINPGKYTLQLTIEDLKSQKVGQSSVELTIKGGEKETVAEKSNSLK